MLSPIAKILSEYQNIAVLGDSFYYPVCTELSLKMKEISYININAYPTGEFLHGHIALLNNKAALIVLIDEENINSNLKSLNKIMSKYNPAVVTVSENISDDTFDCNFHINKQPIINKLFDLILFLQLLSLKTAVALGRDVDNPKGLNKVVQE